MALRSPAHQMRILASNPDTIGDVVLRQPMYRAVLDAGHELLLVVRPSVAPLVPFVAPGARVVELPREVYSDDLDAHWDTFRNLFAAARAFDPDVLLVAPYRWTRFDERLAEELKHLPQLRRIGMSGTLYAGDPYTGYAPESRLTFDVRADVPEPLAEVEKNAALAAAVLGRPPASVDPRIEPDEATLAASRVVLSSLGLEPGGYRVACVTGTANVPIKSWPPDAWARVLSEWSGRHGRRFLFVGLPEERAVADEVRRLMGDRADRTAVWMEPGGTLPQLVGLTALAAGYVGHDTGPMHVAAALAKPVVSVFGGGTWPRFLPRVSPSVAVTVGVSCAECGWSCSFETSHCIKAVPVDAVLRAVEDLEAGRVAGREARALEPSHELQQRMVREGARFAQRQVREAGQLARQLRVVDPTSVDALRDERDALTSENRGLTVELEHRTAEVAHVRGELAASAADAARLVTQVDERERATRELRAELAKVVTELEASSREADNVRKAAAEAQAMAKAKDEEAAALREQVRRLDERIAGLTKPAAPSRPPRRPWRQVATDLFTGSREYVPRHFARPMPKLTVAVPVRAGDAAEVVRATIESILAQAYPHLDFVLADAACDPATQAIVESHRADVTRVVCDATGGPFGAVAKAFAATDGDVVAWLEPGDAYEPGALLRVGTYFRDHPRAVAVYFDGSTESNGWRFPAPPRPRLGVLSLLAADAPKDLSFFLRRHEYQLLGPVAPAKGWAAGWDLMVRHARRYGLRRGEGHVRCSPSPPYSGEGAGVRDRASKGPILPDDDGAGILPAQPGNAHNDVGNARAVPADAGGTPASDSARSAVLDAPPLTPTLSPEYGAEGVRRAAQAQADFAAARQSFLEALGLPGRVRLRAIEVANRLSFRLRRVLRPDRLAFAPPHDDHPPLPGEAPAFVPGQPVSPLTHRLPARLLFTGRDPNAPSTRDLHRVYYDPAGDVALAYPPVGPDALAAHYAARAAHGGAGVVPPDPAFASPYAGYRGGWLASRVLARVPAPYWWVRKPEFGDVAHERLLAAVAGLVKRDDATVRLLNVGCFEGVLLDRLKAFVRWRLAGAETNPRAAAVARSKGHAVWETSAQDAAMIVPVGEQFDVIFAAGTAEHWQDPVLVLRRLRQLLVPGGLIVLNQPNLDSKLLDAFGPTWCHWQLPHHRTLTGRRGLRTLARQSDLRLVRLKTYTDPYPATVSVQLNDLGLGATVPDDARFPNDVSSRGVRLTGWARMLWDWRGRGDYAYAVMKG